MCLLKINDWEYKLIIETVILFSHMKIIEISFNTQFHRIMNHYTQLLVIERNKVTYMKRLHKNHHLTALRKENIYKTKNIFEHSVIN